MPSKSQRPTSVLFCTSSVQLPGNEAMQPRAVGKPATQDAGTCRRTDLVHVVIRELDSRPSQRINIGAEDGGVVKPHVIPSLRQKAGVYVSNLS